MDFSSGGGPSETSGLKAQRVPADLAEVPKALLDAPLVLPTTTLMCANFFKTFIDLYGCVHVSLCHECAGSQKMTSDPLKSEL